MMMAAEAAQRGNKETEGEKGYEKKTSERKRKRQGKTEKERYEAKRHMKGNRVPL